MMAFESSSGVILKPLIKKQRKVNKITFFKKFWPIRFIL
jgi:hypothetical protein